MTELLTSSEVEYDHPVHATKATGVHLVVHIGYTGVEYHHKHSFRFKNLNQVNPDSSEAEESLLILAERVVDADIDEAYLKASPHWESNQI